MYLIYETRSQDHRSQSPGGPPPPRSLRPPPAPDGGAQLPSPCAAAGWAGSPLACPDPCGRIHWPRRLHGTGQESAVTACAPVGARKAGGCCFRGTGPGVGQTPPTPLRTAKEVGPRLPGASLTLWLQPGEDGLGPADGRRGEGLHAPLGRVAHSLDVGVALLGGGVGGGHDVAGGADEGHGGHAVHHAGLWGQAAQRAGPGAPGGVGVGRPCGFQSRPGHASAQACPASRWLHKPLLRGCPMGASSTLALPLLCLNAYLTPIACCAEPRARSTPGVRKLQPRGPTPDLLILVRFFLTAESSSQIITATI